MTLTSEEINILRKLVDQYDNERSTKPYTINHNDVVPGMVYRIQHARNPILHNYDVLIYISHVEGSFARFTMCYDPLSIRRDHIHNLAAQIGYEPHDQLWFATADEFLMYIIRGRKLPFSSAKEYRDYHLVHGVLNQ